MAMKPKRRGESVLNWRILELVRSFPAIKPLTTDCVDRSCIDDFFNGRLYFWSILCLGTTDGENLYLMSKYLHLWPG